MNDSLFKIKDLLCSYGSEENAVLRISDLQIQTGKLIFLLGASGTGKSTLLETLGLMNNTIKEGKVLFYPEENNEVDFIELWKKDKEHLSDIRKKYFSFIFQNTNLMDNFTAYENVMIASMIKDGDSETNILNKTRQMMEAVNLPETEVGLNTLSVNLSGGQRQRLAFVRAITPTSTVLFCDEPTGNLDETNANELFEVIKSKVKEGLTAIVVSHGINLAIKHADWIYVLTKEKQNSYGEVLPENIFSRNDWGELNISDLQDFGDNIRSLFKPDMDRSLHTVKEDSKTKFRLIDSYRSLFIKKEFIALLGKRNLNAIILFLIMSFTFLAIGFANGSLNYLTVTMNDPFVKWLNISIPNGKSDGSDLQNLRKILETDTSRKTYDYGPITFYKDRYFRVCDQIGKSSFPVKARTLNFQDDSSLLQRDILKYTNKIAGFDKPFIDKKDIGFIVTSKMLNQLHYSPSSDYLNIALSKGDSTFIFPVPIKDIVNNLPGNNDIAFLDYFCKALEDNSLLSARNNRMIIFYIRTDSFTANDAAKKIKSYIKSDKLSSLYDPTFPPRPIKHTQSFGNGFDFEVDFDASPVRLDSLYKKVIYNCGLDSITRKKIQRIFYYGGITPSNKDLDFDYMSVYFNDLDKVRDFKAMLDTVANDKNDQGKIQVDMTSVQEKDNINFLSKIGYMIASILILFGAIAICLFVSNLLKMHLNKVKVNIGTFKAIGLGNNESMSIYFNIIISFIILTLIFSMAFSWVTGIIIDKLLNSGSYVENGVSYFILFNKITWAAIGLILLASISVSFITIRKMLSKSPGDLIYNR